MKTVTVIDPHKNEHQIPEADLKWFLKKGWKEKKKEQTEK